MLDRRHSFAIGLVSFPVRLTYNQFASGARGNFKIGPVNAQ